MIRNFFISTGKMSGAVIVKTVTTVLLNKFIAVFSGPGGITLFAHLQNLISIINHLQNDGVNKGYIRQYQDAEDEEKNALLTRVLLLNSILLVIILICTGIFSDFFWKNFQPVLTEKFIYIFIPSTLGIVWNYSLLAYFQAARKFGTYSIVVSITSILILIGSSFILFNKNFDAFIAGFVVLQGISFFISLLFYLKLNSQNRFLKGFWLRDLNKFRSLSEYIIMALSVLLCTFVTDFFIRNYAIEQFGTKEAGYWQAVVRFTEYYKAFFVSVVASVFYAEISARINKPDTARKYFKRILAVIMPSLLIGLYIIYLLREVILQIFYNSEFIPAEIFFPYQLAGDFFALTSFLFVYILMATKRTTAFVVVQALSTVCYIILIFFLTDTHGLEGFTMAHFYRYIFFLLIVVLVNKKFFI